MKRFLILVLVFSILISAFALCGVAAAEETSPYEYAASFAQAHARRDILSGAEGAAANTLSAALTAKGYAVSTPSFRYYSTQAEGESVAYEYKHVIGTKDNGKEKCVLIGSYYGGYEPQDSYGVGNGGSVALSVGTLLYVADKLAAAAVDYNVVVAFWGGLEISGDFSVEDCGVSLDSIALYINLDAVAVGDHDYLYADDVPRAQEEYFRNVASDLGANVLSAPVYKKQAALVYSDKDPYNYSHAGLVGVNRFFMGENIPCVNFFGGAWDYDCGFYRYFGKGIIEGTSIDTIDKIDEFNGGSAKTAERMLAVANIVVNGVTGEGFAAMLDKAQSEVSGTSLNSSLSFYLISFIGTALLFAWLIILYVKQGKDRRENVWEASFKNGPDGDPYEEFRGGETPFDNVKNPENNENSANSDDDNDDVFRF